MLEQCKALTTPSTLWDFCPSLPASYILLTVFILATLAHTFQTLRHHKPYCWILVISGLLQACAYLLRVLSILSPASLGLYAGWFVLILIAPIWTNAFVYMVLGRMVWNFTEDGKLLGLKAWRLGKIFVVLDIIAAIIQIWGAGTASDAHSPQATILRGLHIYMAGIGFQLFFICIFLFFAICLYRKMGHSTRKGNKAFMLLYVMYIAVLLIGARIVFRLVEYAGGLNSAIPRHEVYQYCLDSLLMLIASTLFNVVHPGAVMPGKEGDMPSRKKRKMIGKRESGGMDRFTDRDR
ncbi:hypothetical protein DL98DRAFT_557041 [Cadophora sp. DSE1049]|nr:hypothetical protein DL98DRAFT_557041 [Cadophora sp. DSE1049]